MSPKRDGAKSPTAGATEARQLRRLVACPSCRRQYDAGGRERGEKLRCLCGELLTVPAARATAAPVVRCAACGGPRAPGAARCAYCRAPFAAAERDRNTLCPSCAARIADAARFCPACGTRIDPQPLAGATTDASCPACAPRRSLRSRAFPEPAGNVLECDGCGGLWVGRELWQELERRARREALPDAVPVAVATNAVAAARPVVYRDCPLCATKMHRRNYGGRSGVIVDQCGRHGLWFDADELARALDWVRRGGHEQVERARREEERARERERRLSPPEPIEPLAPSRGGEGEWEWPLDLDDLGALLARLFGRIARSG